MQQSVCFLHLVTYSSWSGAWGLLAVWLGNVTIWTGFLCQQSLKSRAEVYSPRSVIIGNESVRWYHCVIFIHIHKYIMFEITCNLTPTHTDGQTHTRDAALTCKSMHKIENTCLWSSGPANVYSSLSHTHTHTQIIVSNLGPHICRVLQRTTFHQEYTDDLHTRNTQTHTHTQ